MDPFTVIARMIGATAKVGAGVALAGLAVYLLQPRLKLDPAIYQGVIVAGLIGAGLVAVEAAILFWRAVAWVGRKWRGGFRDRRDRAERKATALKNLQMTFPEFIDVLRYLKLKGFRRFPADSMNELLGRMCDAYLLERERGSWRLGVRECYYSVPDYLWSALDEAEPAFAGRAIPTSPPWFDPYRI